MVGQGGKKELTFPQHFVAGGHAGIVESLTCHPLDTIKVNMQVHASARRLNPISSLKLILSRDGPKGFYRGLGAVIVGISPKMAIRFSTFEASKTAMFSGYEATLQNLFAGLVAGAVESLTVVNPTEVLKIRMQTGKSQASLGDALLALLREEGPGGLYKGAMLTVSRQAINQAANFTIYHDLKRRLQVGRTENLPSYQHFLIGAVSGTLGPLSNAPIDTLKTRVQSMENKNRSVSILPLAKKIYREEGVLAFYKGITPRLFRIAPGQAVTFTVYEKISQWMLLRGRLEE